jgi:hypothetical protein
MDKAMQLVKDRSGFLGDDQQIGLAPVLCQQFVARAKKRQDRKVSPFCSAGFANSTHPTT